MALGAFAGFHRIDVVSAPPHSAVAVYLSLYPFIIISRGPLFIIHEIIQFERNAFRRRNPGARAPSPHLLLRRACACLGFSGRKKAQVRRRASARAQTSAFSGTRPVASAIDCCFDAINIPISPCSSARPSFPPRSPANVLKTCSAIFVSSSIRCDLIKLPSRHISLGFSFVKHLWAKRSPSPSPSLRSAISPDPYHVSESNLSSTN